jgi:hypothetical protein
VLPDDGTSGATERGMTQTTWVVLVPCALLLFACDDDQRPPAAYPGVVAQRADSTVPPPPIFVSTTSGTCDEADTSGCDNRCADGDAQACERLRATYVRAYPVPPAPTNVQVSGGAQVVQFFGPVENVYIGQPALHH